MSALARAAKVVTLHPTETQIQAAVIDDEGYAWKPIVGFPDYQISDDGRVCKKTKGVRAFLKFDVGHMGHRRVALFNNGVKERHLVHRLVLVHFVGAPPTSKHQGAHYDGDPANNCVQNLRWATVKENAADRTRHGTQSGDNSHFSITNSIAVEEIRTMAASGVSTATIADRFDLGLSTVNRIVLGRSWKHAAGETRTPGVRQKVDASAVISAIADVERGLSVSEASRRHGTSRQSINRGRLPPIASEKQIHTAVIDHWRMFGLPNTLVATMANEHAHGQPGLTRGLFDLIVFGPQISCGMLELKSERGIVSADQQKIKSLLSVLGIPHAVTFGRDEPIETLEAWGVCKRSRA